MAGWRWRGDRSDLAMARADVEQQAGAVQSERRLRRDQEERSEAMASLGEQHEQDRERAAEVDADVVAALRAGTPACATTSPRAIPAVCPKPPPAPANVMRAPSYEQRLRQRLFESDAMPTTSSVPARP
jgi:hypothetical protein